jgi:hypothetical protein
VVLEARHKVGGAASTDAPWPESPEFNVTTYSYVMSLMPRRVIDELRLERHGYKVYPMKPLFYAFPDGRSLTITGTDGRKDFEEMALGIVHDPQFGPLVMVAAGGILIETLSDRRLALPPLDEAQAGRLVDRLQIRPLLNGVRGAPPADVGALARAVSRLSVLAHDLQDLIGALDVNPLIVGEKGCIAVDALVEPSTISIQGLKADQNRC